MHEPATSLLLGSATAKSSWAAGMLQYVPFFGTLKDGGAATFITRLMEAMIIGGVVSYANIQVQGEKINELRSSLNDVKVALQKQSDSDDRRLRELERRVWSGGKFPPAMGSSVREGNG